MPSIWRDLNHRCDPQSQPETGLDVGADRRDDDRDDELGPGGVEGPRHIQVSGLDRVGPGCGVEHAPPDGCGGDEKYYG